ncbi:MAG: GrpB family protein, partial [Gemmatimonadetes bacterium]|nr:GrpB family protein [Gemmatimonadota bacterium]
VCDKYDDALKRHLVFRDFLRRSPEYVRRLSTLKWQLAEEHDNDRQSYMDGKVALCEEIYEKGLEALGCRRSLYLPFEKKIGRGRDI